MIDEIRTDVFLMDEEEMEEEVEEAAEDDAVDTGIDEEEEGAI